MDLASELVSTAVNEFGEWAYLSVVIGVVVCFDDRICDAMSPNGAPENTSFLPQTHIAFFSAVT